MPGIPVAARATSSLHDACEHLSAEEELAAEESLSIYCKPVEFYNILQRRAMRNPLFLQRCLHYQIKEKHKKRIQMTVSLMRTITESQNVFPMSICLARRVSDHGSSRQSAMYRIGRMFIFRNSPGIDLNTQVQANFTLPEVNKLADEARSCSLDILFVSTATVKNSNLSSGVNSNSMPSDTNHLAFFESGEYCLWGKVSLESLYMAWDCFPNFRLGQRAEIMSTVDLLPCILKSDFKNDYTRVSIQVPSNFENMSASKQVQITISAEEFGAKEKSPCISYTGSEVPSSSLSHLIGLREGNVMFNYRYYNNKLQRTEVTEDFTCPFCLVKCSSFKGLRCHLSSSHDLFNFEFWVSDECHAVNVTVKNDISRSEIVADTVDPRVQTFFYCGKPLKRRTPKDPSSKNAVGLESAFPAGETDILEKDDGISATIIRSHPDRDSVQSISDCDQSVLQFAKTRKLSIECSDSRNSALLRKRQFFHSHKAQPMTIEQVLSDKDSEDEVDDDVADFEDRRMLENFVDVSKDEKNFMHMWNSFVRKHRVIADGHISWACEAFSKLHAAEFVRSRSLAGCWRIFMVKLYNHGLLDARTMNDCNVILEQQHKQNSDPIS
ncbi:polycomb group protein EMBRYONIC FLOWER 2 isoform X1 [Vigna umbellata]|uniref:polycomb group protein EMBRYONIC FLOWER 2 isoform X1 n=1 Tax=Vigna umbellata TaxID=87088 RepID=UPI001F5FD43D|nr:polycomb group protein EMBRYONIC FLOWER 2 isoform X1 [Vigna umbellata]XP_047169359.1 polycomb group protein EMBRYONIC FLOWER 2 isoform X1 [Vigna umbellata]